MPFAASHATPTPAPLARAPPAAVDPRFQLYSELPPHLRLRFIQQRQAAALAALSFFPPSLTYKQHKEAQRILAAATLPVHLQVGQQLEEAVADAAEAEPTTAGGQAVDLTAPCFFILEEGAPPWGFAAL